MSGPQPDGSPGRSLRRPTPNPTIAAMEGYHSPQLDVAVRLNTNEAPEGPPRSFGEAIPSESDGLELNRYPDRACTALREDIARLEGVDPAQVFVANGSNEVLQTLLLAYGGHGRELMSFEPTYALHSHIARLLGMVVDVVERRADFTLDTDAACERIAERRPAVVAVCSPNNPTGLVEPREVVAGLVDAAAPDALTIVDEAYGQFSTWTALDLIDEDTPLVVVRTFSKTWSLAGLRLGYAIAPSWVVDTAFAAVLPYHLDSLKQRLGRAALSGRAEMDSRVARLVEQRSRVAAGLAELDVDQWPSAANFILFRPRSLDADQVWSGLVEQSVLVRNCASWPRLTGCLRLTIGTPAENDAFLDALAAIVGPAPASPTRGET